MNNFNPTRLEIARIYRGFSMKRIADELDIKVYTYRKYEKGDKEPDEVTIKRLSLKFEFPRGWFFEDDLPEIDPKGCSLFF